MAVTLLSHEVSDLCLGKPALRSLSISSTTIADALNALKITGENYLSVWSCNHHLQHTNQTDCKCVGKICMVDIVCYLSKEENLLNPSSALQSPISAIISKISGTIRHVEPHSSLLDAIDLIVEGAQNLVIPIKSSIHQRKKLLQKQCLGTTTTLHNGNEFCWITQEDVIRYLLNLIGLFSPIPAYSIESLGLISTDLHAVRYHDRASSAIGSILDALAKQTSVAVVDEDGILIGEISPFTLACCDETVTAAITTLSAGDLMAYIDCGGPPEDIMRVVKARLIEKKMEGMLDLLEDVQVPMTTSGSSSDEEFVCSPTATLPTLSSSNSRSGKYSRFGSYSTRMVRRAEAIVCHPRSSLVAVMVQALAHRVNYVWVLEDDYSLVGIVTFSDMLKVFREHLPSIEK
ncbi:Cbs domain-containing protein cbsx5 [Thalictrum thalictroides]|uniref:Cbs domain-containing protein cbsx5 n=1 Tax=Thalictrum thalictroides TaxID=46969 RepID=A0A7J6WHQ8_THATH|nr:Cbs domain-containing protein cbsx5 [Thalictrum thalictroides]